MKNIGDNQKEKMVIQENEASVLRWIATLLVGLLLGGFLGAITMGIAQAVTIFVPAFKEGGSWSNFTSLIVNIMSFVGMFWGMVIAIKKVAKTSIKAFIFRAGYTDGVNIRKDVLPVAGLYFLGTAVVSIIFSIKNISLNGLTAAQIFFTILFSLVFTWMQTSWEELVFRGIPLRMTCHNEIGINKRAVVGCIISALMFMAMHIFNPEVQTLSGMNAVFMTISYFIPGILLYVVDMRCGSLLPGLVIHYVNNFFSFVILSGVVSVGGASSIWIDYSENTGLMSMVTIMLSWIPVLVYLFAPKRKNR